MDTNLVNKDMLLDMYTKNTLCMYGRLQLLLHLIESKLGKYGFVYSIQPQTVSFIRDETFTEYITSKTIDIMMYELDSIQDSISTFKYQKKENIFSFHSKMNKEIYHIYRHIHNIIKIYKDYLHDSRTEDT